MASEQLRAGAALIDITPPLGGSIVGYMHDRRSTRVHDPLHARSLVIDNGQQKVVIVVCDLIAIAAAQVNAARELIHRHTGIPPHCVLICATHTHTGPTPVHLFQSEPDPAYLEWLVPRIVDSVRCAVSNLQPAQIGWTVAREPSLVFNRRFHMKPGAIPPNPFGQVDQVRMNPGILNPNIIKPAGPTDPDLSLLALVTDKREPLALLGSYALHYVDDHPETDISANYFAMWAQEMARSLGQCCPAQDDRPAFVAMLANACSGDINNIDVSQKLELRPPYLHMRTVARTLADVATAAWKQTESQRHVPIDAREALVTLNVRRPESTELDRAREILAKAGSSLETPNEVYARETMLLVNYPTTVQVPLQAMRIGDLGIVSFPGEAFVELGLEVKSKSPFAQTMCIGLANDYAGYIATARAHELGGYETWRARSSFLDERAAGTLVERALQLLDELHR